MSYKELADTHFVETSKDCDKCGRNAGEYSNIDVVTDSGNVVGLCLGCLLSEDGLVENERDAIEETLSLGLTENEIEEHESGWHTKGRFGVYSVDFDTRDAESMTQVAVDDFKITGHYIELSGSPEFILEEPTGEGGINKEFNLDVEHTKERINQDRSEEAAERR